MDNTRNTELKDKRMFREVRKRRHIEYNLWQQVARLVSIKTWGKLFKKKNKKTIFYSLGRTITYNLQVQNEGTFSPVTQPCVCHQGAGSIFPFYAPTLWIYMCLFLLPVFSKIGDIYSWELGRNHGRHSSDENLRKCSTQQSSLLQIQKHPLCSTISKVFLNKVIVITSDDVKVCDLCFYLVLIL